MARKLRFKPTKRTLILLVLLVVATVAGLVLAEREKTRRLQHALAPAAAPVLDA